MEAVSIALGAAAVKWIGRLWLNDTAFEGTGDDIVSILSGRLSSRREQRALLRQLESLADDIAERLEPFLSVEIRGIDEGEMTAAARAAQTSLECTGAISAGVVMSADLNAARLAEIVRKGDPSAAARESLSEAGERLYDTLIAECTSYIVAIAQRLPGYSTAQATEMLSRTSKLAELTNKVLEGLPSSSVPASWGPGSEDQRFENKYKKAVSEFCDRLQLYGVTSSTAKTAYSLSVAYISLSVDVGAATNRPPELESADSTKEWPDEPDYNNEGSVRIDAVLDGSDHLLLTGNAGSGKTTLVQWLALSAIRGEATSDPARSWQGRIPFIIPLRRYVTRDFPAPEEFVSTIAQNLAGAMPSSWVHRTLASGRGMLLIDGLDEVPKERRDEVRDWVLSLVKDFPSCKVLVTSRTTAITRGWRNAESFQSATLLPMDFADIRSFIFHWHSAAVTTAPDSAKEMVLDAGRSLLTVIRDKPAIRSLCTSPLLCALICALHLDSGANLPNNRMDVYKTALEMLVIRRDNDRNVDHLQESELAYREREILLRSFALWMHENGASDATMEDYSEKIANQLKALFKVKTQAPAVAHYLLERSGVLREPIPGRVDFVHRTFLEYLAAAAIVDDNSIDRLVMQAHDDHWREVIVMSAGHANSQQRLKLLSSLLDRGHREQQYRPRLYMLAVACMETSPDLPGDLVARLEDALSEVLPPSNMTEAAAVASAGTLAVNMLKSSEQGALVAAACVRALSLIGGEEALAAIATYGRDSRVTVTRQLIRAWSGFETQTYAERVLQDSPLDNGYIYINDAEQLAQLHRLRRASHVYIDLPGGLPSSSTIPADHRGIYGLDIGPTPWLTSVAQLPDMPELTTLALRGGSMADLKGIERYPRITRLQLNQSRTLRDVSAVNDLSSLMHIDLSGTSVSSLELQALDHQLETLRIHDATELVTMKVAVPAKQIHISYAPQLRDISGLADSDQLVDLTLGRVSENVEEVHFPDSLRNLSLVHDLVSRLSAVTGAPQLKQLSITDQPSPAVLEWIAEHPTLATMTWNDFAGSSKRIFVQHTIEQIFRGNQMAKLVLWTPEELPLIPGLELKMETSRVGTYTRSS